MFRHSEKNTTHWLRREPTWPIPCCIFSTERLLHIRGRIRLVDGGGSNGYLLRNPAMRRACTRICFKLFYAFSICASRKNVSSEMLSQNSLSESLGVFEPFLLRFFFAWPKQENFPKALLEARFSNKFSYDWTKKKASRFRRIKFANQQHWIKQIKQPRKQFETHFWKQVWNFECKFL